MRTYDGELLTPNGSTFVGRKVFDRSGDSPTTPIPDLTISGGDPGAYIYATPQPWGKDPVGYNFADVVETAGILSGGHTYRFEWIIQSLYGPIPIAAEGMCVNMLSY